MLLPVYNMLQYGETLLARQIFGTFFDKSTVFKIENSSTNTNSGGENFVKGIDCQVKNSGKVLIHTLNKTLSLFFSRHKLRQPWV